MIKKLFLLLLTPIAMMAQCIDQNSTFRGGEYVKYSAVYNWGWIWINAGEVFFEVENEVYDNQLMYKLRGYGSSLPKYDWIYTVRDTFETFVEKKTLLPRYFRRNTSEGGFEVQNEYWFDYREKKELITKSWNSDKDITERDTFKLEGCRYDVLSMIYVARNLDFQQYSAGEKIPIKLIIDNEYYDLFIRYLGKEAFTTRSGEQFNTIKFSPLLVEGTIFKGGEDMTVWVTDDRNRIPVQVEAKILVGSIKAVLEDYSGLKYEVEAKID